MRNAATAVRALLDEAAQVAFREVERRARGAIRNRASAAVSFCMAMGSASFHNAKGEPLTVDYPYPRWAAPTLGFIDEFDSELKLTGMPMRIDSADAPLLTDW
jgi:hypothetical protein